MFKNLKTEILVIFCLALLCACASTTITKHITYPVSKEKPIVVRDKFGFGYKIKMHLKHVEIMRGKKKLKDYYTLYIHITNESKQKLPMFACIEFKDREDIPLSLLTPEMLASYLTDYTPGQNTASLYGTMAILAQPQITYAPQINTNVRVNTSSSGYIGYIPDRSSQLGYATGQAMAGAANPLAKMILLNSIIAEEQEKFKKWLEIRNQAYRDLAFITKSYLQPKESVAGKISFRATPEQFPIKIKFSITQSFHFTIKIK